METVRPLAKNTKLPLANYKISTTNNTKLKQSTTNNKNISTTTTPNSVFNKSTFTRCHSEKTRRNNQAVLISEIAANLGINQHHHHQQQRNKPGCTDEQNRKTKSITLSTQPVSNKSLVPLSAAIKHQSSQTSLKQSSLNSSLTSESSSLSSSPAAFILLDTTTATTELLGPRDTQQVNISFELNEGLSTADSLSPLSTKLDTNNNNNRPAKKKSKSPCFALKNTSYAISNKDQNKVLSSHHNYTPIEKAPANNRSNSNIFRSTPNLSADQNPSETVSLLKKRHLLDDQQQDNINSISIINKNGQTNGSGSLVKYDSPSDMFSSLNSILSPSQYLYHTSSYGNNDNNNGKSYNLNVGTNPYVQHGHKRISQRYKLITEGEVQICKLQHSKNMISKLLNSKLLRRWKTQRIMLTEKAIASNMKPHSLESSILYHTILEISPISKWEPGQKYCLRVATIEGHYLIQTNNIYVRDQWIHSIIWKKHKFKSEGILRNASRPEILIKEINNMIDMSLSIPLDDKEIYQFPLELISEILQKHQLPKQVHEEVIICLSPLLEKNHPSPEICDFFSKHCRDSPRSQVVIEMFSQVVQRILKHNRDFGRHPRMRHFIQDYLIALMSQNAGLVAVQNFVLQMHSTSSQCPFPRVLPNFVSVSLASIHGCFEMHHLKKTQQLVIPLTDKEREDQLICHASMLYTMSTQEDWRTHLSQLLQSVPLPDAALSHKEFMRLFKNVVKNFAQDSRCEVHQTLLGIREGKEGWLEIFCPNGASCDDDGEMFSIILATLIRCCCKKKRFLLSINKLLPHILSLAERETPCAVETLCAMLDLDGLENTENLPKVIETLQGTNLGVKMYAKVLERQAQLKELQMKGGPRKLTLPSRSTDEDLAKILLSGSFGNLECLSLAFTNVTSACAEYLIKLPSLRYLNLWSTKFGDQGLELISEHLQQLQVLNLCETPVTDKGLSCLASMKQLRKLNLNSTNLSALTFEGLKECLPALQECDIRYTDAW